MGPLTGERRRRRGPPRAPAARRVFGPDSANPDFPGGCSDLYIDNKETQKYGPEAQRNITAAFAKSPAPVRTFIGFLVGKQAEAEDLAAVVPHLAVPGGKREKKATGTPGKPADKAGGTA